VVFIFFAKTPIDVFFPSGFFSTVIVWDERELLMRGKMMEFRTFGRASEKSTYNEENS